MFCSVLYRSGEEKTNNGSKGLSAGTGKHCVFGHLGLFFIWSCFVFCLLFRLFYVISAPVLAKAAENKQQLVGME